MEELNEQTKVGVDRGDRTRPKQNAIDDIYNLGDKVFDRDKQKDPLFEKNKLELDQMLLFDKNVIKDLDLELGNRQKEEKKKQKKRKKSVKK